MRLMPGAAMIFAAGFGTRMMPLTRDRPKPLVEVGGRPLIDHALDLARAAGAKRIVVNLHYKGGMLRDHLAESDICFVEEEPDILDTGGGLRNALPCLDANPVWTLNPDAIWLGPNPLELAARTWDSARMDALLVCIPPDRARGRDGPGDFELAADGRLSRGRSMVFGGAQIVKTDRLAEIDEAVFSLNRLWDLLIADGRCFGCVYPGTWCDVGRPEALPIAERLLRDAADA